jgi:hypothetical protein
VGAVLCLDGVLLLFVGSDWSDRFFYNDDGSRKSYDGRQPIQVSNGTQRAYAAWSCGILGLINRSKETCKDNSLVRVSDNYVVGKGTQWGRTKYYFYSLPFGMYVL